MTKLPRCKNGTRRNKKTKLCEKNEIHLSRKKTLNRSNRSNRSNRNKSKSNRSNQNMSDCVKITRPEIMNARKLIKNELSQVKELMTNATKSQKTESKQYYDEMFENGHQKRIVVNGKKGWQDVIPFVEHANRLSNITLNNDSTPFYMRYAELKLLHFVLSGKIDTENIYTIAIVCKINSLYEELEKETEEYFSKFKKV